MFIYGTYFPVYFNEPSTCLDNLITHYNSYLAIAIHELKNKTNEKNKTEPL